MDYLILIGVENENELLNIHNYICGCGINAVLFREPDLGDSATALCTEPVCNDKQKLFRKFRLWRPKDE